MKVMNSAVMYVQEWRHGIVSKWQGVQVCKGKPFLVEVSVQVHRVSQFLGNPMWLGFWSEMMIPWDFAFVVGVRQQATCHFMDCVPDFFF